MKIMKRPIALLTAAAVIMAMSGCSGSVSRQNPVAKDPSVDAHTAVTPTESETEPTKQPSITNDNPDGNALFRAHIPETPFEPEDSDKNDPSAVYSKALYNFQQAYPLEQATIEKLKSFMAATAQYMTDHASQENVTYSPVSLYMALGFLSGCVNEDTRNMIANAIGTDADTISEETKSLWHNLSMNARKTKLSFANSLWISDELADDMTDSAKDIADSFYADFYHGDFSDQNTADIIADWMDDATNGMIRKTPMLSPDITAILFSALYYKDDWKDAFEPDATYEQGFTTPDGTVITTDFMHKMDNDSCYYSDEKTDMSCIESENGQMRFILPKGNMAPCDILSDTAYFNKLLSINLAEDGTQSDIIWSVPKFDLSSSVDLAEILDAIGLSCLYSSARLSGVINSDVSKLSNAIQYARVKCDEAGFEAAAVTQFTFDNDAVAIIETPFEMTLDRPFLFVIESNGVPLFVGVFQIPE